MATVINCSSLLDQKTHHDVHVSMAAAAYHFLNKGEVGFCNASRHGATRQKVFQELGTAVRLDFATRQDMEPQDKKYFKSLGLQSAPRIKKW